MKKLIFVILLICTTSLLFAASPYAAERAVLTSEILEKEPAGSVESFSLYSKGYYYNEFLDVGEVATIYHNWYYMEESGEKTLTASVPLKIAGSRWRTWSSKNLYLAGNWRVEAVDEEQNVITFKDFTVE